ncbi:MAG: radical SAM protein, partial [Deltaproteobacteria bacterium]|nr:radical SAM protein [Deltaproteobacteria bacterium]
MKRETPNPQTLYLVVNSQCNLRCKMCDLGQRNRDGQFYRVMDRAGSSLSPETIYALLDDTASWKPAIAITGTEPLLYPHLREVARRVLASGHALQITTNGYLLQDYAAFFVEVGLTELWVSMDGPPEIHDFIRGVQGSFERAAKGIWEVQASRQSSAKPRPSISLNFTVSQYNQHCL